MTKRILLSLILWGGVVFSSWGYDFSQTEEHGQTLYYTITSAVEPYTVKVTYPYAAATVNGQAYGKWGEYIDKPTGDITIPNSVIYNLIEYKVTAIDKWTFNACTEITSVLIPNNVESIGTYALNGCTALANLTIGTGVKTLENYAFQSCTSLTNITLNATLTTVPTSSSYYAFKGCTCTNPCTVTIGSGVTSIPKNTFSNLTNVKTVYFNATNCDDFPSASQAGMLPDFASTGGTIIIGDDVTNIPAYLCYFKSYTAHIIIGSSVTNIGVKAFYNSTSIVDIISKPTTPPTLASDTYYSGTKTYPVYVHSGSTSAYQAADYWKTFTNYKDLIQYTSAINFYNGETLNTGIILLTGSGSVTIQNGGKVRCDNILGATPENLIIEDGGQLAVNSSGVQATFQKEINGYTSTKDSYYLIANPTTTVINPTEVDGMLSNEYDLFYFDESEEGAEWRNYKQGEFDLVNGNGYLYANDEDVTLNFAGTVPTNTSASITLNKKGEGTYAGFNLVGNPMSVNITSMNIGVSACSYYKLNPETGVFAVSTDPIIVGEAFMVEADEDGATLNLNPGSKDESGFNNDVIRLEVSNNKYTDVAFLYFGNHLPLTKINHINDEAPMLYIHSEKADRAVAVMNDRSEIKSVNVNFEAKTTGKYTLSCKTKGDFSYLHVIDRLTGEDVDMLLEDEYEFMASKNDNANRFIVKFEYSENLESFENSVFAWQNGNDIIVNGEGELQIFDVMGRMVSTQNVNGRETVNVSAQGVYIFRLNGMTQKIVVK